MGEVLLYYRRPDPTTWVYLSSFLTIGLFFVFPRVWSVRNFDLVLLILLAPGVLMVHKSYLPRSTEGDFSANSPSAFGEVVGEEVVGEGVAGENAPSVEADSSASPVAKSGPELRRARPGIQRAGYMYLFAVEGLLLLRLLLDPLMVRRPKLDPNLTTGGLTFIGISLFIFMMANVVNSSPQRAMSQGPALGPGYPLLTMLPGIPTRPESGSATENVESVPLVILAKGLAIAAHLAIVCGIVLIGNKHFGNVRAGVGVALLYLLVPYTAQMTGRVDHALPAALLLWAVLFYRRPMISGAFLGLAAGLVYYPLFLLPLWISFYWRRGLTPFLTSVCAMLVTLTVLLALDPRGGTLVEHIQQMFGILSPLREASELQGFWALGFNPIWRLPVIVAFLIVSGLFAVWPSQKNLGTLIAGTAAIMVASQFWHGESGGLYLGWFLPMLLLAIFRPNLQDRVALKVVKAPLKTRSEDEAPVHQGGLASA